MKGAKPGKKADPKARKYPAANFIKMTSKKAKAIITQPAIFIKQNYYLCIIFVIF